MYYKLASLISTSPNKTGKTNEIYISQPDANKEMLAGKLFLLAEIESNKAVALKIINFLTNNLNHNYYNNEKIILRERISTLKVEHIFETALAKSNKDFVEFLKNEKIKITPSLINLTVGVVYQNELHFSSIGKNKSFLIYKEKSAQKNQKNKAPETVKSIYKMTNVGKNDYEDKKPKELTKIFADVISGSIPQKGYFLFTNEALPEYLTNKELIDIITKLPPSSAAEQIRKILEKINAYISFSGIIIKNTTGLPQTSQQDIKKEEKISPEKSVESLHTTEETTEKFLSPSGIIDFKKIKKSILTIKSKAQKSSSKANDKVFALKDRVFVRKQNSPITLEKIIQPIKNFFIHIANGMVWIFKTATNKEKVSAAKERIKNSPAKAKEKSQKSVNWFKGLNKKNKILFSIASGLIILFAISITVTSYQKNQEVKQEIFDTLISKIEQKQNQVDANLLYNNEEGAKKLLDENTDLLYQLSQKVKEDDEDLINFSQKHEEQLEKIRHFVIIENPKEIANFSNLNSQANAENIVMGENKIYAGDSAQKTIYSLNLSDNLATAIADLNTEISSLDYPVFNKDANVYFVNNSSLTRLNTENNELKNISLALPGDREDIVAMAGYNNRLYLLDKKDNQIYRMIQDENDEFTKRDPWIQTEANFSNSTSLAIDGYIYVLNKDGDIKKYLSGEEEELLVDKVEPNLEEANKIMVSEEEDGYIYVLESKNNRIIVFDKDGDFILQYHSDKLQNIKDFTFNDETKKLYILNDNSVYEVDGQHYQ